MANRAPGLIPRPVATGIAVVITIMWAGNYIGPVLIPGFERSEVVNTAFMLVAGAIFALGKGRDDPDDDDPPTPAPVPEPEPVPVPPLAPTAPGPEPDPVRDPNAVSVAELLARYHDEYPPRRPR